MTLRFTTGDIWDAPETHALVIPVNTKGVAGAGLAGQAKKRDPGWLKGYKAWLRSKKRFGGSVGAFLTAERTYVVAATKEEWKEPSRMEWVVQCLWRFVQLGPSPLAIPRLGCGLGELDWGLVRLQVIAQAAQAKADWLVYE